MIDFAKETQTTIDSNLFTQIQEHLNFEYDSLLIRVDDNIIRTRKKMWLHSELCEIGNVQNNKEPIFFMEKERSTGIWHPDLQLLPGDSITIHKVKQDPNVCALFCSKSYLPKRGKKDLFSKEEKEKGR